RAIAPDYFLSDVWGAWGNSPTMPDKQTIIVPLAAKLTVPRGTLRVSAWGRTYAETFTVAYKINGEKMATVAETGDRGADLPLETPGKYAIEALLLDDKGRVATRTAATITVI
ncbi:MAG: hypothetical protein H7Y38_14190, partial [Armatimonadetes bacterium]|nr:hypothetical protein [Armatimonadota bacterium]